MSRTSGNRLLLTNGLLEMRAILELGSFHLLRRRLERLTPPGDGHPVLMLPGFLGADGSTAGLRNFLQRLGYASHPWKQGRNPGFRLEVYESLQALLRELADTHGRKVSVIGHSLGGIYARTLAGEHPELVRQVITLGTPFHIDSSATQLGPVGHLYERLNPQSTTDSDFQMTLAGKTPTVPSTSIYSRGDGIAPWHLCMDEEEGATENIRVPGSHAAMPFNLLACFVVADRLAQPEQNWRPFQATGMAKLLYPSA